MIDLKNKKILITGASSGIGRAAALRCSQLGAEVFLTGRNKTELESTKSLLNNTSTYFVADLSKEESINDLIEQLPALDGFIHCAGIISPLPIRFIKQKHINDLFNINFSSAVLLSSGLLASKKINNNGSVVFISSISTEHPYSGGALYISSKAALEAFSRGFALEGASKKIRVNTISPGLVRTKIFNQAEQLFTKEEVAVMEARYPLGIGEPEDIANTIVFLLSDASKWITGSLIRMDGGLLLNSK